MLDFMLPAVTSLYLKESIESSEEIAKKLDSIEVLTFEKRLSEIVDSWLA